MQRRFLAICLFGTALAVAAAPARADQDAVQFFRNIEVTPDAPVHDAVCFFCSVHVDGKVERRHRRLLRQRASRTARPTTTWSTFSAASRPPTTPPSAATWFRSSAPCAWARTSPWPRTLVAMFGVVHTPPVVSIGKDRVIFSPWIFFGPLLVIFLVIFHHRPRGPYPPPAPVRAELSAAAPRNKSPSEAQRRVTLFAWTHPGHSAVPPTCASFCPAAAARWAACWRGSFRSAAITSRCSRAGPTPRPGKPCIGTEEPRPLG